MAYVDIDVHHGDGVQAAFYDDPRVLTISLHEHPATLFPGTGLPGETGVGDGEGYAVNVALPAGTGDAGWLRAFDAVVPPLLRAFKPTVLVSQHGCDSHRLDPLAHLELTVDGQRRAQVMLHDLAHELCDWPLAADRRRRVCARPGGTEDLDAPARDRRGRSRRPGNGDACRVARTGPLLDWRNCPGDR